MVTSCDNFQSQRLQRIIALPERDAGPDAGTVAPPSTEAECSQFCAQNGASGTNYACQAGTDDAGAGAVICSYNTMCTGRCPAGFQPPALDERAPVVGCYFAEMAAAEAASVVAFERMAEDLAQHGAGAELIESARRAAADEVRHYRIASALARRFGSRAELGVVEHKPARSLFEMALENAREGLVTETLGAVMGFWQAAHAGERSIRRAMRRIAKDETDHAVLSWKVHVWAREQLPPRERAELEAATAEALRTFERDLEGTPPEELVARAGLPSRYVARALVAAAKCELYSAPHSRSAVRTPS